MDLGVDKIVPVVIGIDLHRGHLDPAVATMPLEAKRAATLVEANRKFFSAARQSGIPVVHLVTKYRDVAEIRSNPFWRTRADDPKASRKNVERHNLAGLPGTEIMPGLYDPRDFVVDSKKRYDCFRDRSRFHAPPARHQYSANHRHQHLELRARDRHPRQCFGLCACGHRGLRRHYGWSCPARRGARVFPRRFWMGHAQRYRVRRHQWSPR